MREKCKGGGSRHIRASHNPPETTGIGGHPRPPMGGCYADRATAFSAFQSDLRAPKAQETQFSD
jgi:hypothetical protein